MAGLDTLRIPNEQCITHTSLVRSISVVNPNEKRIQPFFTACICPEKNNEDFNHQLTIPSGVGWIHRRRSLRFSPNSRATKPTCTQHG